MSTVVDVYLRPVSFRTGIAAVVLALPLAGVTGCSAAPSPTGNSRGAANPAPNVQDGGVTLDDLGWTNGPAAQVSLPAKVQVSQRVDQPNVITAVLTAPDAATTADWLTRTLPDGGFTVTDHNEKAVLFVGHGWSGSFASTPAGSGQEPVSAITVRKDPGR